MRDALDLLAKKLAKVISNLSSFALKWKGESHWQCDILPLHALLTLHQPNLLWHTRISRQLS